MKWLLLTALLLIALSFSAQVSCSRVAAFTCDKSYMTFGSGLGNVKNLILEGKIQNTFIITPGTKKYWALTFTPAVILRMRDERSNPVRTPSYLGTFCMMYRLTRNVKFVHYANLKYEHHSNGQSGHFFMGGTKYNLDSGNFSTHFFELGYHAAFMLSKPNRLFNSFYLGFRYNPDIAGEPYLRQAYDDARVKLSYFIFGNEPEPNEKLRLLRHFFLKTEWSLLVGDYSTRRLKEGKGSTSSLIIGFPISKKTDFSVFAQAYYGEDYYNVYFMKSPVWFVRAGIMSNPYRLRVFE